MIKVTKKCKISKKELKLGTPIEMEHTTSKRKAKYIASQHLCEFPNYYSAGVIPMEKRLKMMKVKNNMATKNKPKRDGSGRGVRSNRGRGGCKTTKSQGQGRR